MYHDHFGLNDAPFKITPDPHLFFSGGERGLVLEALVYAILNGEGIIKVVGEVGSGKTMLCRMLPEKLAQDVEILYLANPRLTPDTILQAIALEMNLPIAKDNQANHLQVMQALHEALLQKHSQNIHVVLLIEEAQSMPVETLEEIRLVSNLETTKHKLLQVVLFGQPELDENLAQVHIRQLKERITHSFNLNPLSLQEITEYLDFRLRAVGYRGPKVFHKSAVKALHNASEGLLRRINILSDKALMACFAEQQHQVTFKHVQRAAQDSGLWPRTQFSIRPAFWISLLLTLLVICGVFAVQYWQALQALQAQQQTQSVSPPPTKSSTVNEPTPLETATPPPETTPNTVPQAAPEPMTAPPQQTETTAKSPSSRLQDRLEATQQWLLSAKDAHFSIQVMQTDYTQQAEVEKFLNKDDLQHILPQLYVYAARNANKPHWGILFGAFPNKAEAKAALNQLPLRLQRNQPFIRTISSVRDKLLP